MTFFYDMNKKLKEVLEAPKSVNQQLNERDEGKHNNATTGFKALAKAAGGGEKGNRIAGAQREKMKKAGKLEEQGVDEGMFDSLKQGMAKAGTVAKGVAKKGLETLGHGSDEQMRADLQRKMGLPPTGKKPVGEEYGPMEGEGSKPMTPKQKKFAKLAPPADKITFADKIAGAKKEVDEMLGDVAANAMRKAVKGKKVADEGSDWSQLGKEYSRPKIGSVERGAKHDIEHTATGRKVTRRTDDQGMSVGADDDAGAEPMKRGRGRPKGSGKSIGAKGPNGKSKLLSKPEEIEEKAVSKKQQKFMGMVHAAQKGEKPASKEVAKVAKSMKKKDVEDFASTKHKGLPEKVKSKKSEGKKKEKTEEAGGTGTPTASSGFAYGKGIYDSLNREIENIIAESMSINASDSTEGGKSLTITATDDDALRLAEIVRNAGLGGGMEHSHDEMIHSHEGGEEAHEHGEEPCEVCGSTDCGCGNIEEALAENEPDWPTEPETSDDALQYSGGLNGPKSTGQTTIPVIAAQSDRLGVDNEELRRLREMAGIMSEQEQVMAPEELEEAKEMCEVCEATPCKCDESVEESIAKLRGLAGIQEAKEEVEEEKTEEGNRFTGNLAKARAAGKEEADLDGDGDLEKVRESVNKLTNLWKAYKG